MWFILQLFLRCILATLFVGAGVGHFRTFDEFKGIMAGLPFPGLHPLAVWITGLFEMGLGILTILWPSKIVFEALLLLVIAMTPANVNMWWYNLSFKGHRMGQRGHALRALAQILLIFVLWKLRESYY